MSAERISSLASSFGPLLRRYRAAAGLTQEQLAERAGISVRAISDLERGLKRPRRDTVQMIAEALALPPRKRALLENAVRPTGDPALLAGGEIIPPNNLPAPVTTLIGRERELSSATDLLARADLRLLTLTGPGGVGKTQLALQIGADALGQFEDGVLVVMLGPLREGTLVAQAIRDALGPGVGQGESAAAFVRAHLRERQILLILDNFEHVMDAAPLVADLLATCPRLKVLATSREPLRLAGEHELPIHPLDDDAAAALFLTRANSANPSSGSTSTELNLAREICRRVDRLPLAIELAAVWTRVLPLPDLLNRLDAPLDLLTGGRRDAPERQRTLREAIAWSERLLDEDERTLFHRLAIFAGGFAREDVAAVCGDGGEALGPLAGLVEKSLLLVDMGDGQPRFRMLETIHEYALERLEASGEYEEVAREHANHFASIAKESGEIGPELDSLFRRLEHDLPNLRAAIHWARARGETNLGLQILMGLGRFFYIRGDVDEGESLLADLLALDATAGAKAAPPHVRIMALYGATRYALGRRDYERAEAMAKDGLVLAREQGDAAGAGNMLAELGHVAEARGDLDAADAYFRDSMERCRIGRDFGGVGRAMSSLGNLARSRGDFARARRYLEAALMLTRKNGVTWAVAHLLTSLGHVDAEQGDYAHAGECYAEALDLYRAMPNPASVAWCMEGVVVVLAAAGRHDEVATLCGVVTNLHRAAHIAEGNDWPSFTAACSTTRAALGDEAFISGQRRGEHLSIERSVTTALAALKQSA